MAPTISKWHVVEELDALLELRLPQRCRQYSWKPARDHDQRLEASSWNTHQRGGQPEVTFRVM
jgi:hypothetical protein